MYFKMSLCFRVTREHREGLAKNAKLLCDKTKEKLRDIQNRFIRDIKKSKDKHPSDLVHDVQETVSACLVTSVLGECCSTVARA